MIQRRIIDSADRFSECEELIRDLAGQKTLIYFATVSGKYGMYMASNDQMGRYNLVKLLMVIADGKDNKLGAISYISSSMSFR